MLRYATLSIIAADITLRHFSLSMPFSADATPDFADAIFAMLLTLPSDMLHVATLSPLRRCVPAIQQMSRRVDAIRHVFFFCHAAADAAIALRAEGFERIAITPPLAFFARTSLRRHYFFSPALFAAIIDIFHATPLLIPAIRCCYAAAAPPCQRR